MTQKTGHALIQDYLRTLDSSPGVYRMLDAEPGRALCRQGARPEGAGVELCATLGAFGPDRADDPRDRQSMMFLTTRTETEALLLEQNLIKQLKPRYNVLLRDDKSFPNILVAKSHPFAQIKKHRGAKSEKGDYYGPFASAGAVNRTLNAVAARLPAAQLHRQHLRKPQPSLPALPDQALQRPLRRPHQPGRLRGAGRRCRALPAGQDHHDPGEPRPRDGRGGRGDGISNAPPPCATGSRR